MEHSAPHQRHGRAEFGRWPGEGTGGHPRQVLAKAWPVAKPCRSAGLSTIAPLLSPTVYSELGRPADPLVSDRGTEIVEVRVGGRLFPLRCFASRRRGHDDKVEMASADWERARMGLLKTALLPVRRSPSFRSKPKKNTSVGQPSLNLPKLGSSPGRPAGVSAIRFHTEGPWP